MEEKVHGLLLSAIPYLGSARILKVFTAEHGLIPLISKGKGCLGCTTPFCEAEWVFRKGKEEIHRLKDATLLESFSELKTDFSTLNAAGSIATCLLHSQLPSKKGDSLYALVVSYFKKLPSFKNPEILVASFRLKLLLWEGLLALNKECAVCGERATVLSAGESFCHSHGPAGIAFEQREWESLLTLAFARQFSILQTAETSTALSEKIEELFKERLR